MPPGSTSWSRTDGGTAVTGRRVLPKFTFGTSFLAPIIGGAEGHDAELAAGIQTTLERIRATVENVPAH